MPHKTLSITDVHALARQALEGAGASHLQAKALADGIAAAERDGIPSHGLMYLPTYCEHLECGKVMGQAIPETTHPRRAAVVVDAGSGFAHAAIDKGMPELVDRAREEGIAGMAVRNSYNCGVLAYHVERIASAGLLALGFTNAPASIAPVGAKTPVIGTNPFALAVPGATDEDGSSPPAFLIDQSASVVAKSEVMLHARQKKPIPDHWAKDADGNPTTDAEAALKGSMAPTGGYKGFGIGLMVETFAAALTGATLGRHASPFSGPKGGPPKTGQFFLAIDPDPFSGGAFAERMDDLAKAIADQEGARLPGTRRLANRKRIEAEGVTVDDALLDRISRFIAETT